LASRHSNFRSTDWLVIIGVFGTPGVFGQFGLRAVCAIVEACLGPYRIIAKNSIAELKGAWSSDQEQRSIFYAELPDQELVRLFADSGAPYVVMLGDPMATTTGIRLSDGFSDQAAVRLASQSYAALHDLALAPTALLLRGDRTNQLLHDVVRKIVTHYRIQVDSRQLQAATRAICGSAVDPSMARLSDILAEKVVPVPSAKLAKINTSALGGYLDLLDSRPAIGFRWPAELFQRGDCPNDFVEGAESLVGGQRILAFGPYMCLPSGRWVATPTFRIWDNVGGTRLRFDIHTDRIITEHEVPISQTGTFRIDLPFQIADHRLAIQVRVFNWEGSIAGEFQLEQVDIRRAQT
jgi:hypothetical protein